MYESEVNDRWENADAIPEAVRSRWAEFSGVITARSMIPWGEHCTECAIPHCFTTCDLYEKRQIDASCRRFAQGMVCVSGVDALVPWLLKIKFKRWGKLWAPGSVGLFPLERATKLETVNKRLGSFVRALPIHKRVKQSIAWRYRKKRETLLSRRSGPEKPDYLLFEIYNPGSASVALTFYVRSLTVARDKPFTARFTVPPGFYRTRFPVGTINATVNLTERFEVELAPSNSEEEPLLYFGCMDFVRDPSYVPAPKLGGCKCVVWDLDNTVWDGVLIEDGPEKIRLKPGITEIFAELDRRGILLSLASKNNPADVMPVLKRFGLADYILKPQISWEPKSQAMRRIAKSLEIGLDSLLYVDDSPFEREEVRAACPEVHVMDALDTSWLLWREDCQVPATAESASRRKLYRDQERRQEAQEDFEGDYETFLRDCAIRVRLSSIDEALLPRVHELAQRTNQMNFSGTRYTREQLERIRTDKNLDAIAVQVDDRFGAYGIVGLAVVDRERNTLTDLAFSCRIQAKRIEHAVLSYLLNRHGKRPFRARWRKTERNAPAGRVFSDLGFQELGQIDGVTDLEFSATTVPTFEFIEVTDGTRS